MFVCVCVSVSLHGKWRRLMFIVECKTNVLHTGSALLVVRVPFAGSAAAQEEQNDECLCLPLPENFIREYSTPRIPIDHGRVRIIIIKHKLKLALHSRGIMERKAISH